MDCTIPVDPSELVPDPNGERTEVGSLLRTGTVVVDQSVSLGDALLLLRDEHRPSIAVVDRDARLVGVVHEIVLSRPSHDDVLFRPRTESGVTRAMSSAIAVHEATPVRTALRLLASSHLREATVISSDGRPLGVFRDLDGLHWIAGAREGRFEPPREKPDPHEARTT